MNDPLKTFLLGTAFGFILGVALTAALSSQAQGLIDIETQIELDYRDLQGQVGSWRPLPILPEERDPCGRSR